MKFGWKSLKGQTPKIMKRAAKAALALGLTYSGFTLTGAISSEDPKAKAFYWKLTYASLALTTVGTIAPFFFEEVDDSSKSDSDAE